MHNETNWKHVSSTVVAFVMQRKCHLLTYYTTTTVACLLGLASCYGEIDSSSYAPISCRQLCSLGFLGLGNWVAHNSLRNLLSWLH